MAVTINSRFFFYEPLNCFKCSDKTSIYFENISLCIKYSLTLKYAFCAMKIFGYQFIWMLLFDEPNPLGATYPK